MEKTSDRDIRNHLVELGIKNSNVADVIKLDCKKEYESSFCISIHGDQNKHIVLSEKSWPEGVRVRPYSLNNTGKHRRSWNQQTRENRHTSVHAGESHIQAQCLQ